MDAIAAPLHLQQPRVRKGQVQESRARVASTSLPLPRLYRSFSAFQLATALRLTWTAELLARSCTLLLYYICLLARVGPRRAPPPLLLVSPRASPTSGFSVSRPRRHSTSTEQRPRDSSSNSNLQRLQSGQLSLSTRPSCVRWPSGRGSGLL
jgi:hypothetical protein